MLTRDTLSGARVLVVEDNHPWAVSIATLLEHQSAIVVGPYSSERTAMKAMATRLPDLALLDSKILGGTSFELAQWLGVQHVPFAFITGEPLASIPIWLTHVGYLHQPARGLDVLALAQRMWALARIKG